MLYIRSIEPEPDPADGLISRVCMARYLLGLMAEDFSESYYFTSWTDEVPLSLWKAAHGGEVEVSFGPIIMPPDERRLVIELATVSGGWWIGSPSNDNQDEAFLPLNEWRKHAATSAES